MPAAGSSSRSSVGSPARARAISSQRQALGELVRAGGEPHERQQRQPALAGGPLLGDGTEGHPRPRADQSRARAAVAADQDVVEDAHPREQADVLERAAETERRPLVRAQAVDSEIPQQHPAAVGREDAAHAVEQRGLAGPVGSDEGVDGAGLHREVDAVQHPQTTERLADAAQLEQHAAAGRR